MDAIPVPVIWLVAGLVLVLLETLTPGVFLIWLGLAAIGTGLVVQVTDPGFAVQVLVFAVLAAIAIGAGLRLRTRPRPSHLNTPDSGLVGRAAVAVAFDGKTGRVRVGDSEWNARLASGTETPAPQARLRVVGVDGTTLVVGGPG